MEKFTRKVIVGDAQWERKEEIELRDVDYGKERRWFLGDIEFDGHQVLWGFEYFPTTYMKESELSGDEYRKGGEIRYFKDRKLCYTEFCRNPDTAALKIGSKLLKLMEFDWNCYEEGSKIYWRDTPAIVTRLIPDQGALIVTVDGAERFPDREDADEDWMKLEDPKEVKIDIFDPHVWWYRFDKKMAPTT